MSTSRLRKKKICIYMFVSVSKWIVSVEWEYKSDVSVSLIWVRVVSGKKIKTLFVSVSKWIDFVESVYESSLREKKDQNQKWERMISVWEWEIFVKNEFESFLWNKRKGRMGCHVKKKKNESALSLSVRIWRDGIKMSQKFMNESKWKNRESIASNNLK